MPQERASNTGYGIPGQIARITNAVNDIKSAIEDKGGTVPEDAQVDDLAAIVRSLSGSDIYAGGKDPGDLTESDFETMGMKEGDIYLFVPNL